MLPMDQVTHLRQWYCFTHELQLQVRCLSFCCHLVHHDMLPDIPRPLTLRI